MAIQYERVHFRRRAVQFPRSYTESNDQGGGITHTPHPGDVGDPGVLPNEENMNRMDKGIADCVDAINALDDTTSTLQESMVAANEGISENREAMNNFAARRDNPNQVTKEQVGLGNVPNVSTNNQTPTISNVSDWNDIPLGTGTNLATILSKTRAGLAALDTHVNDEDNPHNTGLFDAALASFGLGWGKPDKVGTFTGNGSDAEEITVNGRSGLRGQVINLGFAPSCVAIIIPDNSYQAEVRGRSELDTLKTPYVKSNTLELLLGFAIAGVAFIGPLLNYYHDGCGSQFRTATPEFLLAQQHGGAVVYNNSFIVQSYNISDNEYEMKMNLKGYVYPYLAWR